MFLANLTGVSATERLSDCCDVEAELYQVSSC